MWQSQVPSQGSSSQTPDALKNDFRNAVTPSDEEKETNYLSYAARIHSYLNPGTIEEFLIYVATNFHTAGPDKLSNLADCWSNEFAEQRGARAVLQAAWENARRELPFPRSGFGLPLTLTRPLIEEVRSWPEGTVVAPDASLWANAVVWQTREDVLQGLEGTIAILEKATQHEVPQSSEQPKPNEPRKSKKSKKSKKSEKSEKPKSSRSGGSGSKSSK